MRRALVVIDMQNDFIDGALGTDEAKKIVPNVVELIDGWNEMIFTTQDTHGEDYLSTQEGKKLPVPHCIKGTPGWEINKDVKAALGRKKFHVMNHCKPTFGSMDLIKDLMRYNLDEVIFCGLCSDICVVSNVLLAKAMLPQNVELKVVANCCAGVTPTSHEAALMTMKMCQVDVI